MLPGRQRLAKCGKQREESGTENRVTTANSDQAPTVCQVLNGARPGIRVSLEPPANPKKFCHLPHPQTGTPELSGVMM